MSIDLWGVTPVDGGEFAVVREVASGLVVERRFASEQAAQDHVAILQAALLRCVAKSSEPYGDVAYADPGYRNGMKRYPVDTAEHVRAAWSYINHPDNAQHYTPQQVADIKARIKTAAKKLGVEISS